jgi:hypothetical protein
MLSSFGRESNFQMEGTHAEGTHATAWVTNVNLGPCK